MRAIAVLNFLKQTAEALGGKCDTAFLLLLPLLLLSVEETHLPPSLDVAAYCRHIFTAARRSLHF